MPKAIPTDERLVPVNYPVSIEITATPANEIAMPINLTAGMRCRAKTANINESNTGHM
jgi:hypothetical protein